MSRQKLITVTADQTKKIESGDLADFIKNMISLGAHTLKDGGANVGERIESVQGPYKDDKGAMLFIMNIVTLRSGD